MCGSDAHSVAAIAQPSDALSAFLPTGRSPAPANDIETSINGCVVCFCFLVITFAVLS